MQVPNAREFRETPTSQSLLRYDKADGYGDACLLRLIRAMHKAATFGLPSSDVRGGRLKKTKTEDHGMLNPHKAGTERQGSHVL